MISFKIAIICAFYVAYAILKNRNGKESFLLWIPTIMIILGGYLTINNLLVIMKTPRKRRSVKLSDGCGRHTEPSMDHFSN